MKIVKKPLSFRTAFITRGLMGERLRRCLEGYASVYPTQEKPMLDYWHNEIRQILDARYEMEQVFVPAYEAIGAMIECPF